MREIGGYIELDTYRGPMLYEDGIKLNCGRKALEYLIQARNIRKLYIPKFMCDSNDEVLKHQKVECCYYSVDAHFRQCAYKQGRFVDMHIYSILREEFEG